jgi:hypothetical protein
VDDEDEDEDEDEEEEEIEPAETDWHKVMDKV